MTRTMYDAVTVDNVPSNATLVAGYGDGYYNNVDAFKARFPNATVVEIAVSSHHDIGQVLDVETGDATPDEAPGWAQMRRAAGVVPTIYCNSSTWPAVKAAFASAGVAEPEWWIAQYDGDPTLFPGTVAKQYSDPGPYDLSSVADHWPGVDSQETYVPLTQADATLVAQAVSNEERDNLAFATIYWLRRALDPSIAVDAKNPASIVQETLALRQLLEGKTQAESAVKAELDALKAALSESITILQTLAGEGSATASEVQAGVQAELVKLGQALGGLK